MASHYHTIFTAHRHSTYKQVIPVVIAIYSNSVCKQSLVTSEVKIVVRGLTMAAADKVGTPVRWKGAASPYIMKYVTTRITI